MNNNKLSLDELNQTIIDAIKKAQKNEIYFESLFENNQAHNCNNEFLFFIKPEVTKNDPKIKLNIILEMIQNKITDFGLVIHNAKILSANYLNDYNIISRHYGVINNIASNAVGNMSQVAKERFEKIYSGSIHDMKIMGGIEFLKTFKQFNPYVLDYLWQNKKNEKLAPGTYSIKIKIDNEEIYLINGFHPRQLKHYVEEGRSIIVMSLSGDLDWKEARTNLIGATDPAQAKEGSIRRNLLDNKKKYGIEDINQGLNGVHLSAGPIEALIELIRYNSNFSDTSQIKAYEDFSFGKMLANHYSISSVNNIMSNCDVLIDGKSISVFDLTEELNSDKAIDILSKHFK